jgi:hypothetical protein
MLPAKLRFYGELAELQSAQSFAAMLRTLFGSDWVVYSKPPFRRGRTRLTLPGLPTRIEWQCLIIDDFACGRPCYHPLA